MSKREKKELIGCCRQRVARTWRPMPKVNFVKWTTMRNGIKAYAEDYGYQAFPLRERNKGRVSYQHQRFEPINTGVVLANGLRAGDRVSVRELGAGRILLITEDLIVVQLDRSNYLLERPISTFQHQLSKLL